MKSFKQWKLNESDGNWNQIKSMNFPSNPELKSFVMPKIGQLQDQIVSKLKQSDPKITSFRDMPPELRDQYAQTIISCTLEVFFGSMQSSPTPIAKQIQPMRQSSPQILPQDIPQTPAASRG